VYDFIQSSVQIHYFQDTFSWMFTVYHGVLSVFPCLLLKSFASMWLLGVI